MDQCCGLCRSSKTVTTDPFFLPYTHAHTHARRLNPEKFCHRSLSWHLHGLGHVQSGFFCFFCLFLFWTLPGPQAADASAAISDPLALSVGEPGSWGLGAGGQPGIFLLLWRCLRCHTLCDVSAVPGLTAPSARQKPQRGWNVAMADVDAVTGPSPELAAPAIRQ